MGTWFIRTAICSCLIFCFSSWASAAATYSFGNITSNNAVNKAIGEAQLFVDVLQGPNASQVDFKFYNNGPAASVISEIYFDDGTLLGIAQVLNGPGVSFTSGGANPPNLPGGANLSPAFQVTAGFLAESGPPAPQNGVGPNEHVTIRFNLLGGQTYADALNAIVLSGAPGGLRIGVHVIGFDNGGSESFVNTTTVMPLPAAAWMGMALLGSVGGVGFFRKRRQSVGV